MDFQSFNNYIFEQLIQKIGEVAASQAAKHTIDLLRLKFSTPRTGLVPIKRLASSGRLPGEVFAAELLHEPPKFEVGTGKIKIKTVINRKGVEDVVVSAEGRDSLIDTIVSSNMFEILKNKDKEIHEYFREALCSTPSKGVECPAIPFRWGSGGVLSIVKWRSNKYIPMSFRDVHPVGWNLNLGSSERCFDDKGRVERRFDDELRVPEIFIYREFLEEMVILDREPSDPNVKLMEFVIGGLSPIVSDAVRRFHNKSKSLREKYDHMDFKGTIELAVEEIDIPMSLTVRSNNKVPSYTSNVLVTINCLELGIEVVKIVEYTIPDDIKPYFLDGEVLEKNPLKIELVRMPVALFPVKLLHKYFAGDISLPYSPPSAKIPIDLKIPLHTKDTSDPKEKIILYDWDIKKRMAILDGAHPGVESELKRHREFCDKYLRLFENDMIPSLFTPAAAKTLNLLLSANYITDD